MFNKNKKERNEQIGMKKENGAPENQPLEHSSQILKNAKVYTIPEKFLKHLSEVKVVKKDGRGLVTNKKTKSTNLKKSVLVGIGIGLVFLLALGAAAWMFIRSVNEQPKSTEVNLVLPTTSQEAQKEAKETNKADNQGEAFPTVQLDCGQDNCQACGVEQCRVLSDYCHLQIEFESCVDNPQEECVVQKCLPGADKAPLLDKTMTDKQAEQAKGGGKQETFMGRQPSADKDNDKLTDVEEETWGTSASDFDTDGDGYYDGQEIYNLYSPLAGQAKHLEDSDLVKSFVSRYYGYKFYYPARFKLVKIDEQGGNIMLKPTTSQEFFNLLILDNDTGLDDVVDWYLAQNPYVKRDEISDIKIGGKKAVEASGGLNIYVLVGQKIYLISYQPDNDNQLDFMATFQAWLKTFDFFADPFNNE